MTSIRNQHTTRTRSETKTPKVSGNGSAGDCSLDDLSHPVLDPCARDREDAAMSAPIARPQKEMRITSVEIETTHAIKELMTLTTEGTVTDIVTSTVAIAKTRTTFFEMMIGGVFTAVVGELKKSLIDIETIITTGEIE